MSHDDDDDDEKIISEEFLCSDCLDKKFKYPHSITIRARNCLTPCYKCQQKPTYFLQNYET